MQHISDAWIGAKDLYEMRLIFELEAAYYATIRATDAELERILAYDKQIEEKINLEKDEQMLNQGFIN